MSGALKTIGKVALAPILLGPKTLSKALAIAALIPGPQQPFLAAGAAVFGLVAQVTAKAPPARGSITQLVVASDPPTPYVMGEGYFAGVLRHRTAWGGVVDDVHNPYLFDAVVYSGGGPVQSISPRVDLAAVTSWYSTFLYTTTQLGSLPQAAALVPQWAGTPGWGSAHKLSGLAAIGWSFKFDKAGKVFASGLPMTGAHIQGVKVYDPRLDSTFPGGSGACRLGTESTYVYSTNPALHAGTYAFGRYQNGKLALGVGLPEDAINWAQIASWASLCEANGWTIFGVAFEPGDRWANLKNICAAGGGDPVPGGVLGFRWHAPLVPLVTVTGDDLVAGQSVRPWPSYRDAKNTLIPKYTSAAHNWEQVAADKVSVASFVALDGEERAEEWPFNFVREKDQAAELALYQIWAMREGGPIEVVVKPHLRALRAGEAVTLDLPLIGVSADAVILHRQLDPGSMTVRWSLQLETPAKHAAILGTTGGAPAAGTYPPVGEDRDEISWRNSHPAGWQSTVIRSAAIKNARSIINVPRQLIRAIESGGSVSVNVARHDWDYPDRDNDITREILTVTTLDDGSTPIPTSTTIYVYFDDGSLIDPAPTYKVTTVATEGQNSTANPTRHPVSSLTTPASGSGLTFEASIGTGYGYREF